jgi:hypothetical protein
MKIADEEVTKMGNLEILDIPRILRVRLIS